MGFPHFKTAPNRSEEYFRKVKRPEDCVDPKVGFEIYAVGVLKESAPLDVWRIDQTRSRANLQTSWP